MLFWKMEEEEKKIDDEENFLKNDEHCMSEKEIEDHELATKIRTINFLEFGKHWCNVWYYTPLPPGYHHIETIYYCEYCLNFYAFHEELCWHSNWCKIWHPPGDEIYWDSKLSVFEVDGQRQ